MEAISHVSHDYSSEIGFAGEITQTCLAIAARLLKPTTSSHLSSDGRAESNHSSRRSPSRDFQDDSFKASVQTRRQASLSRKKSKLETDEINDSNHQRIREDSHDGPNSTTVPGFPQGNTWDDAHSTHLSRSLVSHVEVSAEQRPTVVQPLDSRFREIVGQLRLWADGLGVGEGQLDKALERSTTLKTALFTVFASMSTLLIRGTLYRLKLL
jgi:hypothetical protein